MPSFSEMFPSRNEHIRVLFGLYLKRKRTEYGFTKKAVAQNLGVGLKKYSQIEAGASLFDEVIYAKLVNLYMIDSDDLIELSQISKVRVINEVAEALCEHFPA